LEYTCTWKTEDEVCEEKKSESGIEAASVGSTGVKMLSNEAHVDIAIIIKKEMNGAPGTSSRSSIALADSDLGLASFDLEPRKLE